MGFRLLPVERGMYDAGQDFEIDAKQTLRALCTLADLWLADDDPVAVEPLMRVLMLLKHGRIDPTPRLASYDKGLWESIVLVDTDGSVYGYADRFNPERCLGNIFMQPFSELLAHDHHQLAVLDARARITAACSDCRHYRRTCTGDPMGEGANNFTERDASGALRCIVTRGHIDHLERRLIQAGILDPHTGLILPDYRAPEPSVAVAS
jgi:uncharacterized protein